jgi:transposase
MKPPIPVTLSETDRASLQTFIHMGKANARTHTRARVLLKAAEGWTDAEICEVFDISRNTSIRVRQVYLDAGLEAVLHDKRQVHRRQALTGSEAAHLIAIACTRAARPRPLDNASARWQSRRVGFRRVDFARNHSSPP